MSDLNLALCAATELLQQYGVEPDRCDILQNGHTLVVRLTETLVARIVQAADGLRQGTAWFERENVLAQYLTRAGAPVIPMHPALPVGPHLHGGFPMNFWTYVKVLDTPPDPFEAGKTLGECHAHLKAYRGPALPPLAILTESLTLLETVTQQALLPTEVVALLRRHLEIATAALAAFPAQPLHGDAHLGNLLMTPLGPLWTDWEDAFAGPVEWDVASLVWNARILDNDSATVERMLAGYRAAGGHLDEQALQHSWVARAAVMTAWYPILYPKPNAERQAKLQRRIDWLRALPA